LITIISHFLANLRFTVAAEAIRLDSKMISLEKNTHKPKIAHNRIAIIMLASFAFIICRLVYLQVFSCERFYQLSTNNFTRIKTVQSPRGNICDIKNNLLATNRPVKNIVWQGSGLRQLSSCQLETIYKIGQITNLEINELLLKKIQNAERYEKELIICEDIDFSALSKIEEQFSSNQNIAIQNDFKRFYPQHKIACHVIGYLGTMNINKIGKMGIERLFEESLKGKEGLQKATINSLGKKINEEQIEESTAGATIVTTLDLDIQKICENSFAENYSGSMIIMDPKTGAIRALLSRPDFDPTIFLEPIPDHEWQNILQTKPFINRALNACYPPASLFKLITVASGLELGFIHSESFFRCNGHIIFGERRYHCHNHQGHGRLTIKQAMAQSCNILFYKLAQLVSVDTLAEYARKFGLGSKTGIIFPENEGLVPSTEWKYRTKGERWWTGETLSTSIGQSYLLATPIQIARMICGLFEGYLTQPRILESEPIVKIPLNIRAETFEFLKDSMKKVVTTGTGIRVNNIKDLTIYAKTGTAQTCSLNKNDQTNSDLEHAWLAGNFSYKNEAPLTIVILVEHAGSTRIALNIAKKFLNQYRQLMAK
jgi:penicillin-binding protein 2